MGDYTPKPSRRTQEARAERESQAQRAQTAYRWQSAIKNLVILVLLLGLLAGLGYYLYPMVIAAAEQSEAESTENNISVESIVEKVADNITQQAPRDDSYTVTEKVLIPGSLVDKSKDRTQKSKDYADWVDPSYILICRGNTTQHTVYFQTNEEDFAKAFVGANAQHSYVTHWTKLSYEKYLRLTRDNRGK